MRDRLDFLKNNSSSGNLTNLTTSGRQFLKQRLEEERKLTFGQKLLLGNASSILGVQADLGERVQVLKSDELSLEALDTLDLEDEYGEAISDDEDSENYNYDDSLNDSETTSMN